MLAACAVRRVALANTASPLPLRNGLAAAAVLRPRPVAAAPRAAPFFTTSSRRLLLARLVACAKTHTTASASSSSNDVSDAMARAEEELLRVEAKDRLCASSAPPVVSPKAVAVLRTLKLARAAVSAVRTVAEAAGIKASPVAPNPITEAEKVLQSGTALPYEDAAAAVAAVLMGGNAKKQVELTTAAKAAAVAAMRAVHASMAVAQATPTATADEMYAHLKSKIAVAKAAYQARSDCKGKDAAAYREMMESIPRVVFFLGAGCSKSSGVPTGGELMAEWRRVIIEGKEGSWTHQERAEALNPSTSYGRLMELRYRSTRERNEAFRQMCVNLPLLESGGYHVLATLMKQLHPMMALTLTTNFDEFVVAAHGPQQYHTVRGWQDVRAVEQNLDAGHNVLIKLHGDYLTDTAANTGDELVDATRADAAKPMRELIKHYIMQHDTTVIFLGYGGTDSNVRDLFSDMFPHDTYLPPIDDDAAAAAATATKNKLKVYWVNDQDYNLPMDDGNCVLLQHWLRRTKAKWVSGPRFDPMMLQLAQVIKPQEHFYKWHDVSPLQTYYRKVNWDTWLNGAKRMVVVADYLGGGWLKEAGNAIYKMLKADSGNKVEFVFPNYEQRYQQSDEMTAAMKMTTLLRYPDKYGCEYHGEHALHLRHVAKIIDDYFAAKPGIKPHEQVSVRLYPAPINYPMYYCEYKDTRRSVYISHFEHTRDANPATAKITSPLVRLNIGPGGNPEHDAHIDREIRNFVAKSANHRALTEDPAPYVAAAKPLLDNATTVGEEVANQHAPGNDDVKRAAVAATTEAVAKEAGARGLLAAAKARTPVDAAQVARFQQMVDTAAKNTPTPPELAAIAKAAATAAATL